jgi:hypothetical protein
MKPCAAIPPIISKVDKTSAPAKAADVLILLGRNHRQLCKVARRLHGIRAGGGQIGDIDVNHDRELILNQLKV